MLLFPAHPALPATRRSKIDLYSKHSHKAVRALADFNSDHSDPAIFSTFPNSSRSGVPRLAGASALKDTYGFDSETARAAARGLRGDRAGWPAVTATLEQAPRCLCHLDFGRGNVVFENGKAAMLDFGLADVAPVGTDLHTVLRYAPVDKFDRDLLVAIYVAEFGRKGIELDTDTTRLAMEARFAARYTDPRIPSARPRRVFFKALETARRLTRTAGDR